jgi:hypothetical protein
MSVENFIAHEPEVNSSTVAQGTEMDAAGVRFPYSREIVEGSTLKHIRNELLPVLGTCQPADPVDCVIAEVKSGEPLRLNSVWRKPAESINEFRVKYVRVFCPINNWSEYRLDGLMDVT